MSYQFSMDLANTTGQPKPVYGEYLVPFTASKLYNANASIVTTLKHWWIPHFEIPFLLIVILVGFFGNISIIGAIFLEKKLKFAGNAFIVNLAVADLILTSYVLPGVLANVIMNRNMFPPWLCSVTALVLSISCIGSMYSLMFVAINRYVAIARNSLYTTIFTNKKIGMMIFAVWMWSFLLSIPPAFGWGAYRYHKKIHVCMYDCNAEKYLSYTISYVCLSIIVPFSVTCLSYRGVFTAFNRSRNNFKRMKEDALSETKSTPGQNIAKKRTQNTRRDNRERRLVVTLLAAVALFTICWLPYALIILINHNAPAFYKRSAAWLAFTNSAMNSILYGVMNQNFRNGYRKLWGRVFMCCGCFNNVAKRMMESSAASAPGRQSCEASQSKAMSMQTYETATFANNTISQSNTEKSQI